MVADSATSCFRDKLGVINSMNQELFVCICSRPATETSQEGGIKDGRGSRGGVVSIRPELLQNRNRGLGERRLCPLSRTTIPQAPMKTAMKPVTRARCADGASSASPRLCPDHVLLCNLPEDLGRPLESSPL